MPTAFFDKELARLRESIIQMGEAVERMLDNDLAALWVSDADMAQKTVLMDEQINEFVNRFYNKTILLIATNQPVAGDLRFLAASLRLANDLERIGDLSANLARRARGLASLKCDAPLPDDLDELAILAREILAKAMSAFAHQDVDKARSVLEMDSDLDQLNRQIRREIVDMIARDGTKIYWGLEIIYTAAHLERLGDHATNLAEDVIYIYSGRNVRHCGKNSCRPSLPAALAQGDRVDHEDLEDLED